MRTFSTIAIFALALTGANAAVYTGDNAVTQAGVVQVGDANACPCLLYTSPSPRDGLLSRMPSSA